MTEAPSMSDHDAQASRAGRVRTAAAVLFFSGVLIGGTLGRVSIWLLPGQVAPPPQLGQISRALEPADVAQTQAGKKAAPKPEEKVKAEVRLPETAASPSAPQENAAPQSETVPDRPPMAPTTGGPAPDQGKPETAAVSQPAPRAPSVTLLNPGAVQESANERPTIGTRAAKEKAAAQEEPSSRGRRERRAASTEEDVGATGRERDNRRDYRTLREEMLRRER
jgi:hypothetical protein